MFCFIETDMPLLPPISIGGLGLLEVDLCLSIIAVAFSTLQTVKTSMPCMCSSQKPEEVIGSPGTRVSGSCELPMWVL